MYNHSGITRKAAAEILSDIFESEYIFEDNSYHIKDQKERVWEINPSDNIQAKRYNKETVVGVNYLYQVKLLSPFLYENDFQTLENVLEHMELRGAIVNASTK